jgi:heptosyltransferase I
MMPYLAVQSKPQTICVVRLSAIGDTCHALAVVRRLQDNWPDATITWIIGKTEAMLMAGVDDVELIIFDKSRGRHAYDDVRKSLGDRRFDVALCMHASMRVNILCRNLPADVRLGFDKARARDFQWLFTDERIAPAPHEHALDAMMSFASAIGAVEKPLRWDLPLAADAREYAARHTGSAQPTVVISPCSSQRARNFRNWRIGNYKAVIRRLCEVHGCRVLITGGGSELEMEYGQALADASTRGVENLVGRSSLQQLAALINAADLVICPDSGPAHIASAVGTPVIGLYATSNPNRTGPYVSRDLTVDRYPDAVRQFLGKDVDEVRWGRRVRDPHAMDLITIDDVISKIDDFFEK